MTKIAALVLLFGAGLVARAADVTGTWSAAVVLDAGTGTATFVLEQKGETVSATVPNSGLFETGDHVTSRRARSQFL